MLNAVTELVAGKGIGRSKEVHGYQIKWQKCHFWIFSIDWHDFFTHKNPKGAEGGAQNTSCRYFSVLSALKPLIKLILY